MILYVYILFVQNSLFALDRFERGDFVVRLGPASSLGCSSVGRKESDFVSIMHVCRYFTWCVAIKPEAGNSRLCFEVANTLHESKPRDQNPPKTSPPIHDPDLGRGVDGRMPTSDLFHNTQPLPQGWLTHSLA